MYVLYIASPPRVPSALAPMGYDRRGPASLANPGFRKSGLYIPVVYPDDKSLE